MNSIQVFLIKAFRKFFLTFFYSKESFDISLYDSEIAYLKIYNVLISESPCMIARFGSTELNLISNYLGVCNYKTKSIIKYITNESPEWWWEEKKIQQLQTFSGFFPNDLNRIIKFCELMISDMNEVNVLGVWRPEEKYFKHELKNAEKIALELLNPYFSKKPWTMALEGKKVLVVHPFATTIEKQYLKRQLLFENNLLPQFDLKTIKAVQSLAGNDTGFNDWFDALEYMKAEIDKTDYDICLIGAGAYGFPLAAHVKRMGKKSIHLGGSLQLLFGIKGARWESPNYNPHYNYAALMNQHWVRPDENEKFTNADIVEGGCYW
jgi:hypothetical protein